MLGKMCIFSKHVIPKGHDLDPPDHPWHGHGKTTLKANAHETFKLLGVEMASQPLLKKHPVLFL